jgi:hypothetical protein
MISMMLATSPESAYEHLNLLERVDSAKSAFYRELAQAILADQSVCLEWRLAIADRLNQANQMLGMLTVGSNDDSY